jgi:hypothetical protein
VWLLFDVCSTGEFAQVDEPNNQASSMFFNDVEPIMLNPTSFDNDVEPHKLRSMAAYLKVKQTE